MENRNTESGAISLSPAVEAIAAQVRAQVQRISHMQSNSRAATELSVRGTSGVEGETQQRAQGAWLGSHSEVKTTKVFSRWLCSVSHASSRPTP